MAANFSIPSFQTLATPLLTQPDKETRLKVIKALIPEPAPKKWPQISHVLSFFKPTRSENAFINSLS